MNTSSYLQYILHVSKSVRSPCPAARWRCIEGAVKARCPTTATIPSCNIFLRERMNSKDFSNIHLKLNMNNANGWVHFQRHTRTTPPKRQTFIYIAYAHADYLVGPAIERSWLRDGIQGIDRRLRHPNIYRTS